MKSALESVLVFGPKWVSYERSRGICRGVFRHFSARVFFVKIPQSQHSIIYTIFSFFRIHIPKIDSSPKCFSHPTRPPARPDTRSISSDIQNTSPDTQNTNHRDIGNEKSSGFRISGYPDDYRVARIILKSLFGVACWGRDEFYQFDPVLRSFQRSKQFSSPWHRSVQRDAQSLMPWGGWATCIVISIVLRRLELESRPKM